MNRLEMAQKLFENPKLKAKDGKGHLVVVETLGECRRIIYGSGNILVLALSLVEGESWEIIEPKLKEFDFGEAYHIYYLEPFQPKIKSCVSGEIYDDEDMGKQTLEELKGKWTIEGYYED